jgi:modulator of FtsH protease
VAYEVEAWSDFFVATAGATAALTGLVFVAVSINLERILSIAGLPDRALSTLLLLLGALVVAVFGLAPGQSDGVVGAELAVSAALAIAVQARLIGRIQAAGHEEAHVRGIIAIVFMGTVPFLVGGLSLAEGSGGGLYWVLAGTVAALAGGVANAWVLLVEVLR